MAIEDFTFFIRQSFTLFNISTLSINAPAFTSVTFIFTHVYFCMSVYSAYQSVLSLTGAVEPAVAFAEGWGVMSPFVLLQSRTGAV